MPSASEDRSRAILLGRKSDKLVEIATQAIWEALMRKLATILAAGLVAAALLSPANAADTRRTVTETYSITSGFVAGSTEGSIQIGTNWAIFTPRAGETHVSLSIADATGRPVLGKVFFWDSTRRGWADRDAEFCAATDRPLRVGPHDKIYVGAYLGTCANGTLSVVTTGTITATFTK